MARSSSIFYLAQQKKLPRNGTETSLSSLAANNGTISRFHRERMERIKSDVQTARSVCTTLRQLFEVLCIKQEDLTALPAIAVFKSIRTLLRQRMQIEIALIGNPTFFTVDTVFRITAGYDLNKDPDIVAAKELNSSIRMNAYAKHRMEQAGLKINNFLLLLHTFEAISMVTVDGALNGEQGFVINNFLEKNIFPAEGKQFLQSCFTQIMEQKIIPMELAPEKRFLRPFPEGPMLNNYLRFMAELAVYSYEKPNFTHSIYSNRLEELYSELHMKIKSQSSLNRPNTTTKNARPVHKDYTFLAPFTEGRTATETYLDREKKREQRKIPGTVPQGINLHGNFAEKTTPQELTVYRNSILRCLISSGFYNPEKLQFHGIDSLIYINEISISNSNLYSTTCNPNEFGMWNFAINTRHVASLFDAEKGNTFVELDNDARRLFAIGISGHNGVYRLSDVIGGTLGGCLEYRLLVEGFLGTIDDAQRRNAFMWLIQWYNQFFAIHDKTMYEFTAVLNYLGSIIALYSYLYPNDITPAVNSILEMHPYTVAYPKLMASLHLSQGKKLTEDELTNLLFQVYVNTTSEYNLNMRISGQSALLLRKRAFLKFKAKLKTEPKLAVSLAKSISLGTESPVLEDRFRALEYYKKTVFGNILPPELNLQPPAQIKKLIDSIKQEQKPFLSYLQNSGRNVVNEVVFRFLEAGLTPKEPLSPSLVQFKKQLILGESFSYDEIKRLFNISINSRNEVLAIIYECARICDLSMYPNPTIESYEETVSAFDYLTFQEGNIDLPVESKLLILPLRLAVDAATSYSTEERILAVFAHYLGKAPDFSGEEKNSILDYASKIIRLRQLRGGSCRVGSGLRQVKFTDDQLKALHDYFILVQSAGDQYAIERNIRAINTKLANKYLDIFLDQNQGGSYGNGEGADTGSGARGVFRANLSRTNRQITANWNGISTLIPNEKFNSPDNLDQSLIAQKMKETDHVRKILSPIFSDEEDTQSVPEGNTDNGLANSDSEISVTVSSTALPKASEVTGNLKPAQEADARLDEDNDQPSLNSLAPACRRLLMRLLQLQEITREDFKKLCAEEKLMPSAALERINDWAYECFDCSILEDDDVMFFDRELLAELL